MNKITQFTIKKNTFKKAENQPDRTISAKLDNDTWVDLASGWVKTDKSGNQYISAKMNTEYKERDAYVIVSEKELDKLQEALSMKTHSPLGKDYPVPGVDAPEIDPVGWDI